MVDSFREVAAFDGYQLHIFRLDNQAPVHNLGRGEMRVCCWLIVRTEEDRPRFCSAGTKDPSVVQERGLTAKAPALRVGATACLPFSIVLYEMTHPVWFGPSHMRTAGWVARSAGVKDQPRRSAAMSCFSAPVEPQCSSIRSVRIIEPWLWPARKKDVHCFRISGSGSEHARRLCVPSPVRVRRPLRSGLNQQGSSGGTWARRYLPVLQRPQLECLSWFGPQLAYPAWSGPLPSLYH